MRCRLSDVDIAVQETDGKISFFEVEGGRDDDQSGAADKPRASD